MAKNKERDGSLLFNRECLKEVKDKMKREVIQETDKRKDGRVQFSKDQSKKRAKERN